VDDRQRVWLVAVGGAAGALARYGLSCAFPVATGHFPTTTLLINLSGAFLLGALLEALLRRGRPDHWLRMLGGVGVLGAFTTFSTLANETALLGRDGHTATAVAYDAASLVGGVAAVVLGLVVAGWRYRPPLLDEGES
jgi:CrcB protein